MVPLVLADFERPFNFSGALWYEWACMAGADKRERLVAATEEIILRDGYAAVSSRRVAAAVGIQASLVHYYFPTLDELFVAVLRRRSGRAVERMSSILAGPEPMRAWWRAASDPRGSVLMTELIAAAHRRPALHDEVARIASELRRVQVGALESLLPQYGLDPAKFPPVFVATAIQGMAYAVVQDETSGFDTRPDEARAAIERFVDVLEAQRAGLTARAVAD